MPWWPTGCRATETQRVPLIDIHCHMLPAIDDGAADRAEALAMARMAVADGITAVVATPHQLGPFTYHGGAIRQQAQAFQQVLDEEQVALRVVPGAELRIEAGWAEANLVARLHSGELLTLADRGRHVLLDLPERVYIPFDRLVADLAAAGMVAILAHPERNREIMARPELLKPLAEAGCLFQVTAGSLLGEFSADVQMLAERMVRQGTAPLVASDAHHLTFRKPLLAAAALRVAHLAGAEAARLLCEDNPAAIVAGGTVVSIAGADRSRN